MSGLYLYNFNGRIYWGRHQHVPGHRNVIDWVFRRKPVVIGRIYKSGPIYFTTTQTSHGRVIVSVWIDEVLQEMFEVRENICYYVKSGWVAAVESQHETARTQFANAFRNRLKEYGNSYFVPLSKHLNNVR